MRYYGFIIKANNALIAKNTKIRLREYDFESNIGALNLYMYRNLRNGQLFVAYREEGDSLLAEFSFDENKDSFPSAYNSVLKLLDDTFHIRTVKEEPLEITMNQFLEGIDECRRRGYFSSGTSRLIDTANIWFYYDKNANDGIICGGLDFKEIIIRDRKAADPGMFHPSFLSELKTISEHKLDGDLPGSMVHYILSAGSISAAADLAERLSQKLFEAGRIESRRVGIVSGIKPDLFNRRNHLEDIIENNRGGVLLVDLSETFGHAPSEYTMAADYLAGIFKTYRSRCLFIFMYNMDKPGFSYFLMPTVRKYALTVPLKEGTGNRKSAVKYLRSLISGSEYSKYSGQAAEFLRQYKGDKFTQTEILEAFEAFGPWCLSKNVFNTYLRGPSEEFLLDRDENAGSAWEKLQKLIGLEEVKKQIDKIITADIVEKRRKEFRGKAYRASAMHMVFSGSPGTAKTTVARLFAGIAKEKGILKSGVFAERRGTDLNCTNIEEAFTAAKGGVLFVDEAYAIVSPMSAALLIQEMENRRDDVIVIFAGYTDRMKGFLELNEGLKSRIPYYVDFPDYSPAEMTEIFKLMLDEQGFTATEEAVKEAYSIFERKRFVKDLGNGRYVRNLVENAVKNQALRIMPADGDADKIKKKDLFLLKAEDIYDSNDQSVKAKNEEKTMSALAELDSLIGLDKVKDVVHKAIRNFRYNKLCLDNGIKRNNPTMHMVFTGNPGTAKTTVARLIGRILAEEGILPTGEFIEAGKPEIVSPIVGGSPILVKELFRKAKGGVLFIDEAYSINGDPLCDDAITAIVQEMENNREDTVVIFAGYPDRMQAFLDRNPGMRSRIAFNISFDDYSVQELMEITNLLLAKSEMTISDAALEKLRRIYEKSAGTKDFGNGRFVREMLEQAEMNLSDRVMDMDSKYITPEVLGRIEECDITDISAEAKAPVRRIGFAASCA
ncbi:AAA+-type ATPase, SpoVK/Ycf46/Vps4 family [Ruminococcaceae bacterium FB2012]|nr:AAA+-type ATPase, SpoVK/Ycf46/Vps4 family [Ruminococcaceae bacterium FB2012]